MDTDVALGTAHGDVDDGFALAALFCAHRSGRIRLAGVSTVSGNTSAARAQVCARRIAGSSGAGVEIVAGAEGAGHSSSASARIAGLRESAEILALGPLTNLAAALGQDPALPRRVSPRLVRGNVSSRGFLPPFWPLEFNLAVNSGRPGGFWRPLGEKSCCTPWMSSRRCGPMRSG